MAINLWKLGGKPRSYNPLPTGYGNSIVLSNGDYTIKLKAKSDNGSKLTIANEGSTELYKQYQLGSDFQTIELTFFHSKKTFYLITGAIGDIIIEDIQLVQKPLPKLTINGISGELTDWLQGTIINATYAQVPTFQTPDVASGNRIRLNGYFSINGKQDFYLSLPTGYLAFIVETDGSGKCTKTYSWVGVGIQTTDVNSRNLTLILKKSDETNLSPLEIINIKPMLNLGSLPAPYSKKTGERMVLPSVKGRNLLPVGFSKWVKYSGTPTVLNDDEVIVNDVNKIDYQFNGLTVGKTYTISVYSEGDGVLFTSFSGSSSNLEIQGFGRLVLTRQATNSNIRIALLTRTAQNVKMSFVQLEEGITASAYEPYAVQVNKKPKKPIAQAKSGLAFNGVTDVFTTTDITVDEIEFELSPSVSNKIQALSHPVISEGGSATNLNGYIDIQGKPYFFTTNTDSSRTDLRAVIPLPLNTKSKVKFSIKNGRKLYINDEVVASDNKLVTGNAFRFGGFSYPTDLRFQGTLYKVTCYLAGNVVAEYDFENPANIIGDKVVPVAKNLIPSFEDSRWSLHANFKVLGKDVGRLEATDNWQSSIYTIPNLPVGNKYTACLSEGRVSIDSYDQNNMKTVLASRQFSPFTFTVPNGSVRIEFLCTNFGTGSYTFAKPQLYELSGKEGTIVGNPSALRKAVKRLLYSKR